MEKWEEMGSGRWHLNGSILEQLSLDRKLYIKYTL